MSCINAKEIIPENKSGIENFKFVSPYEGVIYVYHNIKYSSPSGHKSKVWLCCTEGWRLKEDNKWHETINCGWKPDRIVDTVDDIINCYRPNVI